jgi:hypothetical protein
MQIPAGTCWRVGLAMCVLFAPALVSAGKPMELARGDAPRHPRQPQVAVDDRGSIHVVYGAGDLVFYRRSDDGGRSFLPAIQLPRRDSSQSDSEFSWHAGCRTSWRSMIDSASAAN